MLQTKEYLREFYKRRRSMGLCIKCNNPIFSGSFCLDHFTKQQQSQDTRRERRKLQKICLSCGKVAENGLTECPLCLQIRKDLYKTRVHLDLCVYCGKNKPVINKRGCESCSQKRKSIYKNSGESNRRKQETINRKKIVFDHYGGKCSCCGENIPMLLNVDHKNNDGRQHRRSVGNSRDIYKDIILRGFPDEYQLLCWSCNMGKHLNGGMCPHQEKKGV